MTYFFWKNSKEEVINYLQDLKASEDFFQPNFWTNTPDINPFILQGGNQTSFMVRYFLAATLSSNYGIYGPSFELMHHDAIPGKEAYQDSEIYEIKHWNLNKSNKLLSLIKMTNRFRRENVALQEPRNIEICQIGNDQLLAYFKQDEEKRNNLLMVVNLDIYQTQTGWLRLPFHLLDGNIGDTFIMKDLLTGNSYHWDQEWNYIELNPNNLPCHLFLIERQ